MLVAEPRRDGAAPVAPLGEITAVSEDVGHQCGEHPGHPAGAPGTGRPAGEGEPRERRRDDVECVLGVASVAFRVRERTDDVEELHDGSRPPVRDDQRQGVRVAALLVNEVDVDPVDRRREVGKPVDAGLLFPPVEPVQPPGAQLLHVVEVGAVTPPAVVGHFVPGIVPDPPADIVEGLVRNLDSEMAGPAPARRRGCSIGSDSSSWLGRRRGRTGRRVLIEGTRAPSCTSSQISGRCRRVTGRRFPRDRSGRLARTGGHRSRLPQRSAVVSAELPEPCRL